MTENTTMNRLNAGQTGLLSVWLMNNIELLRGKGYSEAAKLANAQLSFDVTEPNVRNLATATELPELADIHPKVHEERLARRVSQHDTLFKQMAEQLDGTIGHVRNIDARSKWAQQTMEELIYALARDLDVKSWAAKLVQCTSQYQEEQQQLQIPEEA